MPALARLRSAPPGSVRRSQWRILVSATAAVALTAPGQTVGLSVFVDPLINDLHLTRTQISTAYLIGTLTGAAALPWVGRALDRWGVRRLAIVIAAGFGAVLVGLSWVTDLVGLTFGYVAVRLAGQGALTLVATTAVALWFDRRRGTASGISTAGAIRTVEVAVIPRHFGTGRLGALRGIVHFVTVASSAFGPIVLALGYAASGSYAASSR